MMRNFKKAMLTTVAAVSMMMSLVACGSSKEDYENDFREIVELDWEDLGEIDDLDEIKDGFKSTKVSTKEGKAVKKAFEKKIESMEEIEAFVDDFEGTTERTEEFMTRYESIMDKQEKVDDELYDSLEAFFKAAEEAGVDEELLEDFDF